MDNNDGYFEFKEELELPEELDYNRLEDCPHCKKPIPNDATMCLYCGEQVNRDCGRKHWWLIWTAAAAIIILGVLALFR